jgi:CheY-like chemotaxis protein
MSRVLMSDSAALFRLLEPSFLKRGGWAIGRAAGGRHLVEAARSDPPDLILIDSECLGDEPSSCLGLLKSDPALQSVPVVTIGEAETADRCRAAGADAAVSRPVEPEALVSLLCSLAHVPGRREARCATRSAARIETARGALRGRVKDIGPGGLFVALREPLSLREPLVVRVRLPVGGVRRPVRARGIVVRQVFADPSSHLVAGVGIRFTDVDAASRRHICAYVAAAGGGAAAPEGAVAGPAPVS